MGYILDIAGVKRHLSHDFLSFDAGNGEYGELVVLFPGAAIVEIPDGRVRVLWLVARVVWLIENEGTDGVELGSR